MNIKFNKMIIIPFSILLSIFITSLVTLLISIYIFNGDLITVLFSSRKSESVGDQIISFFENIDKNVVFIIVISASVLLIISFILFLLTVNKKKKIVKKAEKTKPVQKIERPVYTPEEITKTKTQQKLTYMEKEEQNNII